MKKTVLAFIFVLLSVFANAQSHFHNSTIPESSKKLSLTDKIEQIKKTHLPLNYKNRLRSLTDVSTLDSSFYWKWDWFSTSWGNILVKTINTYNSTNNKTAILMKTSIGTTWRNYELESFTYDVNNNLINDLNQYWDSAATVWVNSNQVIYTYDANNNKLSLSTQYWNGTVWINANTYLYTYDANNNQTGYSQQQWDTVSDSWKNIAGLFTYSYDSNNNLITETGQYWDGTSYVNGEFITYTYDTNNNQISKLGQLWDSSVFVNSILNMYTYDANNNKTEDLMQNWTGSSWSNYLKYLSGYDSNNNLLNYIEQSWADSIWGNAYTSIFTYDANNNNTGYLSQIWDDSTNNWFNNANLLWTYDVNNNMTTYTYQIWDAGSWIDQGDNIYTYDIKNDQTSAITRNWDGTQWINYDSTHNYFAIKSLVWPGDANNDLIVDNNDLLPIGLYYSQSGIPRSSVSNVWEPDTCANWGLTQSNGSDLKHADCNGDGIIDNNDTLAISMNFTLTHTMITTSGDERTTGPDMYIVTSNSSYGAGEWVNAEVWLGSSVAPVSNLYGIAFDISYNADLVQTGTESIDYTSSWLGNPDINLIKISMPDPVSSVAHAAEIRTDHANTNGYGKIATFRFQIKNTITSVDSMNLSISGYNAVDASGSPQTFNPIPLAIEITTGIHELENDNSISIFPNPYSDYANINYTLNKNAKVSIQLYNTIGQIIETLVNTNQSAGDYSYKFSAKEKGYNAGVYFVKITVDGKSTMKRVVEMK